jgi:hypothetical protein
MIKKLYMNINMDYMPLIGMVSTGPGSGPGSGPVHLWWKFTTIPSLTRIAHLDNQKPIKKK